MATRKYLSLVAAILSLAFVATCCGGSSGGSSSSTKYTISGVVSGATAADVTILLNGDATRSTTTDGNGSLKNF